jgi:hypothetical protein
MTPMEFQVVYPKMMGWIRQILANHATQAKSVASQGFKRLPLYFSEAFLRTAKFVAVERVPVPPLSALGLNQFGAFEQGDYAGITFLDTYFLRYETAADESLHFHEMIHVLQWDLLGPERFLAAYGAGLEKHGYRTSPLEAMAYEAQRVFDQNVQPFNARQMVVTELEKLNV